MHFGRPSAGSRQVGERRRRRRGAGLLAASIAAAGLTGALGFLLLTEDGKAMRAAPNLSADLDGIAESLGFGIAAVQLQGQRYTLDTQIYKALDAGAAGSQLGFDTTAAEKRIEQLPWVKSARVRRLLPDRLAVDIVERTPFAMWRTKGGTFLIDGEGRVLVAVTEGEFGLPVVSGEGAAGGAAEILAIASRYPELKRRLIEARRVADRRWDLVLAGGTELLLPVDGPDIAVTRLMQRAPKLIEDATLAAIDLRTPGSLFLRKVDARVQSAAAARPPDAAR
ncbi:MAG: cell division protein FtsQ/DivIB [Hyphomicrobiaceae bacterium]